MNCFCDGYCDDLTLDRLVTDISGTYSCRDRIEFMRNQANVGLEDACTRVSMEFPSVCGQGCNPKSCNDSPTPTVVDCGCLSCNGQALGLEATDGSGTYTCGDRIDWVMGYFGMSEKNACVMVSDEFPSICGQNCDPRNCDSYNKANKENNVISTPPPPPPDDSTGKKKKKEKKKKQN